MSAGLLLLSRLDVNTPTAVSALYLFVLGLGLGSTMQVLVLAVQNAVPYDVLGSATSGVTMFRGIGGSLGTAIFGTIFTTRLTSELRGSLHGPLGVQVSRRGAAHGRPGRPPAGAGPVRLPARLRPLAAARSSSSAAGVTALGFVLSLFLQERTLRGTAASSTGLDDSLAAPRSPDSLAEIERSLTRVTTAEERTRFRERVAQRAGVVLSPGATWALVRICEHGVEGARALAAEDGVPAERITEVTTELTERRLLSDGRVGDGRGSAADGCGPRARRAPGERPARAARRGARRRRRRTPARGARPAAAARARAVRRAADVAAAAGAR